MDYITIVNARQNNLKNISLKIPKKKITVFTGVSGSGKSSLVLETIGAEAQRQFNETQPSFIRTRLQHVGIADVDKIDNLNVPVIINQKRLGGGARSTVGTATDIYSSLRLLFARIGKPFVGYSNVFSFNNPLGMCSLCEGLGFVQTVNIDTLLDKGRSLNEGAITFPTFQPGGWRLTRYTLSGYFDNDKKLRDYSDAEWELLLNAQEHKPKHPHKEWGKTVKYEGLIPRIEKAFLKKDSKENIVRKDALKNIVIKKACPACAGKRLNEEVLSCKINGKNIADCAALSIDELLKFVQEIDAISYHTLLEELKRKLQHIVDIGLQYLSLDRRTDTLSGGESQRIKMVRNLGSSLTEMLYIFDEPSIGLHPRDIQNIVSIIRQIRDKGNTVLIVEHDPDLIKIADWIIDMGPGSGKHGGSIIYQGKFSELKGAEGKTATYFSKRAVINSLPRKGDGYLTISHASLHSAFGRLCNLGLEYLILGQRLDSFSGGERQRLKLVREIDRHDGIIVLDEPSTGLHPADVQRLMVYIDMLVSNRNTLIVVEHNLDIIANADWIIDLGPGAGQYGGKLLYQGTVIDLLKSSFSITGQYLRQHLDQG